METQQLTRIEQLPVRFPYKEITERYWRLMRLLAIRKKGQPVLEYLSRSNAEQAVILHCINRGWQRDQIVALFDQYQPGHYADIPMPEEREAYLDHSIAKAVNFIAGGDRRKRLADQLARLDTRPWPGHEAGLDRLVYRALLEKAYQLDRCGGICLSVREIAKAVSASESSVLAALKRLEGVSLISVFRSREDPLIPFSYTVWDDRDSEEMPISPVQAPEEVPGGAEIWAPAFLGRSAYRVYTNLSDQPQSVSQLERRLRKKWNTVKAALKRLEAHGLAEVTAGGWRKGERSLCDVAEQLDTGSAQDKRIARLERQQTRFREWVETIRAGQRSR